MELDIPFWKISFQFKDKNTKETFYVGIWTMTKEFADDAQIKKFFYTSDEKEFELLMKYQLTQEKLLIPFYLIQEYDEQRAKEMNYQEKLQRDEIKFQSIIKPKVNLLKAKPTKQNPEGFPTVNKQDEFLMKDMLLSDIKKDLQTIPQKTNQDISKDAILDQLN